MENNFSSNMDYRKFLVKNADSIVQKNQIMASTNCSDTDNYPQIPENNDNILDFNTRIKYLKKKFLEASMSAPSIKF